MGSSLGSGPGGSVRSLAIAENGDLVAGYAYLLYGWSYHWLFGWGWWQTLFADIGRWNGQAWTTIATRQGDLLSSACLPGDDYLLILNNDPAIYRYYRNTGAWQSWASFGAQCRTLQASGVTSLDVLGDFYGPQHYQTTCPAALTTVGPGCPGSGGIPETTYTPVPWVGATSQSRTVNLGSNAMAFQIFGFSDPNTQLASLTPLAGPGCVLHANPDIAFVQFPFAGEIATSLTIPNSMAFAGITMFHQVVQMELDQSFQTIAVNLGNAVRLVTGSF